MFNHSTRIPFYRVAGLLGGSLYFKTTIEYSPAPSSHRTALHTWTTNTNKAKRAVVVGAGVAGVCSAYELSKRGYQVIVVDAAGGPGDACSAVAAGGMLRSNPIVDRAAWRAMLSNVCFGSEFRYFYVDWMRALTDPHFLRWSLGFAFNSLVQPEALLRRQREMLKFTNWAIDQFYEDEGLASVIQRAYVQNRGALLLNKTTHSPHCVEPNEEILDSSECICSIEPFVGKWLPDVSTAAYQPNANSGNSEIFTKALAEMLVEDHDVEFYYNTAVKKIHSIDKRVTGLELSDQTQIEFQSSDDCLLIAAGSWTPKLLWQMDEYVPIYPLKGYCIEIPNEKKTKIRGIVSDGVTYFSRLGKDLRIAVVGEFGGWESAPTKAVDRAFRRYMDSIGIDVKGHPTRCGLRPMSTDGAVIVGRVDGWENMAINTGPGSNGWKIAPGAAKLTVDSIENEDSSLPFDSSVLLSKGRVKPTFFWSKLSMLRHG